jgi:hypothetical protein
VISTIATHALSLAAAAAILLLGSVLFIAPPSWDAVARWQMSDSFKTISGYVLLALMAGMWLPVGVKERLHRPRHRDYLKLAHQWLGVLLLVAFLLHANLSRSGFLALLTASLFVVSGVGLLLSWMQGRGWIPGRRWVMAAHIAIAGLVSSFSLLHVYFVFAYAG